MGTSPAVLGKSSRVGLDYWLLSALAGFLWACPIVAISNSEGYGTPALLLGSVIGVLMGALILPWIRHRRAIGHVAAALGVLTLLIAAPGFVFMTDALRTAPYLHADPKSLLMLWLGVVIYTVFVFGFIFVTMASLTVYGLWRWLDFRNRSM